MIRVKSLLSPEDAKVLSENCSRKLDTLIKLLKECPITDKGAPLGFDPGELPDMLLDRDKNQIYLTVSILAQMIQGLGTGGVQVWHLPRIRKGFPLKDYVPAGFPSDTLTELYLGVHMDEPSRQAVIEKWEQGAILWGNFQLRTCYMFAKEHHLKLAYIPQEVKDKRPSSNLPLMMEPDDGRYVESEITMADFEAVNDVLDLLIRAGNQSVQLGALGIG